MVRQKNIWAFRVFEKRMPKRILGPRAKKQNDNGEISKIGVL
jgi:hypothetical protein